MVRELVILHRISEFVAVMDRIKLRFYAGLLRAEDGVKVVFDKRFVEAVGKGRGGLRFAALAPISAVAFGKTKLSSLLLSTPFGRISRLLGFVWRSTVFRDATISLGCKPFRCACIPH